ncbi:hypothetical protein KIPB_004352 [Kipferlia bialata]|uniref:Uncharacterized protein n=1 Tax=Kipferlia bialata TaxID=797122 RepID=A0A9K3CVW0_9EUKA|nr:hypothetical protein KIPB_004352 [Kipferlia bialata]|eukprot:g4352.t1
MTEIRESVFECISTTKGPSGYYTFTLPAQCETGCAALTLISNRHRKDLPPSHDGTGWSLARILVESDNVTGEPRIGLGDWLPDHKRAGKDTLLHRLSGDCRDAIYTDNTVATWVVGPCMYCFCYGDQMMHILSLDDHVWRDVPMTAEGLDPGYMNVTCVLEGKLVLYGGTPLSEADMARDPRLEQVSGRDDSYRMWVFDPEREQEGWKCLTCPVPKLAVSSLCAMGDCIYGVTKEGMCTFTLSAGWSGGDGTIVFTRQQRMSTCTPYGDRYILYQRVVEVGVYSHSMGCNTPICHYAAYDTLTGKWHECGSCPGGIVCHDSATDTLLVAQESTWKLYQLREREREDTSIEQAPLLKVLLQL